MFKSMINVCWAESLKLRRSQAPIMTVLAYAMAPVAALLILLSGDPGRSNFYRFSSVAAQIEMVHADWPSYFGMLADATAIGGLIVFGLFIIWIFGREHSDRTSKELLTLPISREVLVLGKIKVAALWCLILQCGMLSLGLLLGACVGLPLWSSEALQSGLCKIFCVTGLTFFLAIPFALIANLGRGTMAAVGALFMCVFFALIFAALGWGPYFPWAIPSLYSGVAGVSASGLGSGSFYLVFLTGLVGLLGTMAWWRWADQR
jgi:ABC-2 type transport system permease protein